MTALYDRSVVCPICDATFESKKVKRSSIAVERRDDDYCAYYKGVNPMYYSIFVCPSCGFSSFESEFDGVKRLSNRFKDNFRRKVTAKWQGQEYKEERDWNQAIASYKLALITYNALDYKKSSLAKVFLRIAWLHRYNESPKELTFLKYAREYFIESYEKEDLVEDKENELITMLIVGELSRRLGDYKMAVKWFDKLLKDPDVKKKRHIELRARDLWSETSVAYKKQRESELSE